MLSKYPRIKTVFLKFTTIIASFAMVERLYSFASLTDIPRRHALSNQNFEILGIIKAKKAELN